MRRGRVARRGNRRLRRIVIGRRLHTLPWLVRVGALLTPALILFDTIFQPAAHDKGSLAHH